MERSVEALTDLLEKQLFVPVEASGRHVHLTKAQAVALFGHDLTQSRGLSQPGQFLAAERVDIIGPKGELCHVAVLGPCSPGAQVELSVTDARSLGMGVPVRLSGDTTDSPGCTLRGPMGTIKLKSGVIAAKRHIHMSPEDAHRHKVKDGDRVGLKMLSGRPVLFQDVVVRVHKDFQTSVHLDYDEANACGWKQGALGLLCP